MTTMPLPAAGLTLDTRLPVFVSSTGKVHLRATYRWGMGIACSDRFVTGTIAEALVRDIDCEHCIANDLPATYEVRLPDKRYRVGYRVVHAGLAVPEEADRLAEEVGENAYVAPVRVDGTEDEETDES